MYNILYFSNIIAFFSNASNFFFRNFFTLKKRYFSIFFLCCYKIGTPFAELKSKPCTKNKMKGLKNGICKR